MASSGDVLVADRFHSDREQRRLVAAEFAAHRTSDQLYTAAMEKNQKVSLGCGTLILIALIVLILGNASDDEFRQEIKALRNDVRELQSSLDAQSRQIDELEAAVGALAQALGSNSKPR